MATADIAFSAWGETLEETFVAAATAVVQVMVENLDAIRPCQERRITVEHEALDLLLFNFLQEPVYYKDAEQLLLVVAQVEIAMHEGRYRLTATARASALIPTVTSCASTSRQSRCTACVCSRTSAAGRRW